MENENKKVRAKYEKKERARLIRLSETCYNNDPRIKKELEEAEAERQRKKNEKKDFKAQQAMERDKIKKDQEDRKAAEAQAKIDAENAAKEAVRQTQISYRNKVKELIELCKTKL